MGLKTDKLGKYIEVFDLRNTEENYGEESVVGISTQKTIINTKANLSGVSLSSYKIFLPGQFAYVSDTSRRGDKVSLVYNSTEKTYLVSSITTVFYVKDIQSLLPDYLFMYFNRAEFDRYARFNSWGSAREVFSWEDMCDIDIELPDIEVQQKYVNIYKAMVANQQSYERGLEDLKLSIDASVDRIKTSTYSKSIGEILIEIDHRNDNGEITNVQGINILKQFMPSVADANGLDFKKYKIVNKGQFAFSGMQTGRDECIRIALYQDNKPIIISPAYSVFELKDKSNIPEYIMIWFSRKESDRRGWFMSDSSIRSNLDLSRFYEIKMPVPKPEIQESIVKIYRAYLDRKRINEQLKAQIKNICPILIRGSLENGG